jgi:hypothetical protein
MKTRLALADAAVAMGQPADQTFSRPRDLDSVEQLHGRVLAHRWRKPNRYAMRRLKTMNVERQSPLTLKRIFDILDEPYGDRVGVMVLALSDEADGTRKLLATIESLRLTGLHDGLLELIEARAIAADADVVQINATHAATRLAAIDRGYLVNDSMAFARGLLHQVGNHVGHAIDLDARYAFDAPSALSMWAEGCEWITQQLNALLPLVADGNVGSIKFSQETSSIDLYDHPDFVGATLAAVARLSPQDLREVRISGNTRGPVLPLVFAGGVDSPWNHLAACVPVVYERPLTVDLREQLVAKSLVKR